MTNKNGRSQLSPAENLAVGSFSGALETFLQMPILTYKFCLQEGRAPPNSIIGWYRGVAVQAGTVAPITAIQFMVNGMLQKIVLSAKSNSDTDDQKLSEIEIVGTAAGAGAISALVYSPVDLTTIQQQKLSLNPLRTIQHVTTEFGVTGGVLRGFMACAARESVYTAGYLGLSPVVISRLDKTDMFRDSHLASSITGACIAGTAAAIVTHPIDTVKTMIQADIGGLKYTSARMAAIALYNKEGIPAFFRGAFPRTIRVCGAFFVCTVIREWAIDTKTEMINNGSW